MTGRGVLSLGANSREGEGGHVKRAVKRAIRGFFIWGRTTYRGKRLLQWRDLVRNFPIQVIAQVRGEIAVRRQYWAQQMGGQTTDDESIYFEVRNHQFASTQGRTRGLKDACGKSIISDTYCYVFVVWLRPATYLRSRAPQREISSSPHARDAFNDV